MPYEITCRDDADGNTILQYTGDAQAMIDACAKEARGQRERGRFAPKRDMRKVMEIDPVVALGVAEARGMSPFDPALWETFKGRDYSKFRCVDDGLLFGSRRRSKRSGVVSIKR